MPRAALRCARFALIQLLKTFAATVAHNSRQPRGRAKGGIYRHAGLHRWWHTEIKHAFRSELHSGASRYRPRWSYVLTRQPWDFNKSLRIEKRSPLRGAELRKALRAFSFAICAIRTVRKRVPVHWTIGPPWSRAARLQRLLTSSSNRFELTISNNWASQRLKAKTNRQTLLLLERYRMLPFIAGYDHNPAVLSLLLPSFHTPPSPSPLPLLPRRYSRGQGKSRVTFPAGFPSLIPKLGSSCSKSAFAWCRDEFAACDRIFAQAQRFGMLLESNSPFAIGKSMRNRCTIFMTADT